jgi:chromosome segregation ATPase
MEVGMFGGREQKWQELNWMIEHGAAFMQQQARQIAELTAQCNVLKGKLKAAEAAGADVQRLKEENAELLEVKEASEDRVVELENELDEVTQQRDEVKEQRDEVKAKLVAARKRVAALELTVARAEQRAEDAEDRRVSAEFRAEQSEAETSDERERRHHAELQLNAALATIGFMSQAQDRGAAVMAETNPRRIQRAQAALARASKTDLSDEVRVAALEEAKVVFGDLAPKFEGMLKGLRGAKALRAGEVDPLVA